MKKVYRYFFDTPFFVSYYKLESRIGDVEV